jgi:Holliday junction resolvase-like predicted endonuclease
VNANDSPKEITVDVTTDWFWEGNVVNALAHHLAAKGWKIESQANTHSRERGVDLQASKQGIILLVEAKGYPSKSYRDPRRANEQKSTNPINQAEKWYSHAVLKALRLQTSHPETKVALAFPDFPRYRVLFDETKLGLAKLGIAVLLVNADSEVWEWGLD